MAVSVRFGGRGRRAGVNTHFLLIGLSLAAAVLASGCASVPPPRTVPKVDLQRFMGSWHVAGGILTWFERDAHNAVETYSLDEQGRIQTTYSFRRGGFDGPRKEFPSVAFVHNQDTKAEWRIQFFWPFRFPYLVLYLDPDYQVTAVGTEDRKYLWIMSREPVMDPSRFDDVARAMGELGFATNHIIRVPQQPANERSP